MKLKKFNAILAVLSAVALVVHMGYTSYAFLAMYYNPTLKGITCGPFIICACLHGMNDNYSKKTYLDQYT